MLTRDDSAPIAYALSTNRVKLARMMMLKGAEMNSTEQTYNKPLLHFAGEAGQLLAVRFIVEECNISIRTRDGVGQDLRAAVRKYRKNWAENPGCVAVDTYAKKKGVVGNRHATSSNEDGFSVSAQTKQSQVDVGFLKNLDRLLNSFEITC